MSDNIDAFVIENQIDGDSCFMGEKFISVDCARKFLSIVEMKSSWIDVTDRLPSPSNEGVKADNFACFNLGRVDVLCFFHDEARFTQSGCDTQKPTHWMLLPDPPIK